MLKKEEEKFLGWKQFLIPVVLRLRGIILPPPIMGESKIVFTKPSYLSITSNETEQNSKSKPKKFSFLCTFNMLDLPVIDSSLLIIPFCNLINYIRVNLYSFCQLLSTYLIEAHLCACPLILAWATFHLFLSYQYVNCWSTLARSYHFDTIMKYVYNEKDWGKKEPNKSTAQNSRHLPLYSLYALSGHDIIYTDKKENQIILIFKEIQNGAVAKSYMTNG